MTPVKSVSCSYYSVLCATPNPKDNFKKKKKKLQLVQILCIIYFLDVSKWSVTFKVLSAKK